MKLKATSQALRLSLLVAAIASLSGCILPDDKEAVSDLSILHINDHHSRLDAETTTLKLNNAAGVATSVTVDLGGFARVKAAIDSLAVTLPNPLKLHAGDALTGDLYYTLSEGEADAALMNTVCFDAFAIGNHEFDNGNAGLRKFIDFLHAGKCRTPVLSANVQPAANDALARDVAPFAVVERGGAKFGIVGLTVRSKTQNASRPDASTVFEDEVTAAQRTIDKLRQRGIGRIILLSHQGYEADVAMAAQLSDVDLIVGGDSHTLLGPDGLKPLGLTPLGSYPTMAMNKNGTPVCVVQAWQYSYAVGELRARFKGDRIDSCAGQPRILLGDSFKVAGAAATAADAAAFAAQIAAVPAFMVVAPDAAATAALAPFKAQKEAIGSQIVGGSNEDLCLRRVPGPKRDTTRSKLPGCNDDPVVVAHGGNIQQLVANAYLEQGKTFGGADISIQNGGGVRIDIASGPITVGTVYSLLPFKNTLVRLSMTGSEVKAAIEDGVESVIAGTGTGAYPYSAGLRWKVDMNQAKGARVSALEFKDAAGNWVPFDGTATYNVIVNDFMAGGGDNYTTLKGITGSRREDTFLDYADAFLQYVKQKTPLSKPAVEDYSTQIYVETP